MKILTRYLLVGTTVFCIDLGLFYGLYDILTLPFWQARVLSFLCAASLTWWGNRTFTFTGVQSISPVRQYARHLAGTILALTVNLALGSILLMHDFFSRYSLLTVALCVVIATAVNFQLSRHWVFSPSTSQ